MENTKRMRVQDDLYDYVNGDWIETAVIPEDRPFTGGFSNIDLEVEKTMMRDFKEMSEGKKEVPNDFINNAILLYSKANDIVKRNNEGITPLMRILNKIKGLESIADLNKHLEEFLYEKVVLPFNIFVEADMKNTQNNALNLLGTDTILPDKTYYDEGNPAKDALIPVYKQMCESLLNYTDLSNQDKEEYLNDTIKFDEMVSKIVKSREEWADYVNNYNPMTSDEVCEKMLPLDLKGLLINIFDKLPEFIIVYEPLYVDGFKNLFNEENFKLFKHWSYVKTLVSYSSILSENIREIGSTYSRALSGVQKVSTIEKQAYQISSQIFSEPVGLYYGETYFGEQAKKDVIDIVKKIIETYKKRVSINEFLKEETKEKAIKKLSTIEIKMGYPDKVDEFYKTLIVDEDKTFFDNVVSLRKKELVNNFKDLFKPVDRSKWVMPGHMVNACYNPSFNDITFPAAILQTPFYSINQTRSENLGGIGAVIGHEITHAFDNNGSHFDENGNLFNWWTDEDSEEFKKRTKAMIEQYDGIPLGNGKVNGTLVVSENIADNGGMAVTLEIMNNMKDANYKEYFLNWGRIWCMKAQEQYTDLLLSIDVHSPAILRANITPRNFDEWYKAFDVKETDKMYIPSEKRIHIW